MVEVAHHAPPDVWSGAGVRTSKFAPAAPGWADFVAGPENKLAAASVERLLQAADAVDDEPLLPNPLLLYGPPSSGKTHLTRCVAETWQAALQPHQVLYQTAADLAGEYGEAMQRKEPAAFWGKFRSLKLWVLEDLEHLQNKPATQRVVIRLADRLLAHGGQWVATAQSPPWKLTALNENLRGRLSCGLCVPLVHPAKSTRQQILLQMVSSQQFMLPEESTALLAEALPTVREMLGAARFLDMASRLERRPISVEDVRSYLADRLPPRSWKVSQVAAAVARHYGLKVADLKSPARTQHLAHARSLAMYLSRELTESSLNQIGRYFGRRDHTTVLHSCRKISAALSHDAELMQAVTELQRRFPPTETSPL